MEKEEKEKRGGRERNWVSRNKRKRRKRKQKERRRRS